MPNIVGTAASPRLTQLVLREGERERVFCEFEGERERRRWKKFKRR
jgi:hypothetical protein